MRRAAQQREIKRTLVKTGGLVVVRNASITWIGLRRGLPSQQSRLSNFLSPFHSHKCAPENVRNEKLYVPPPVWQVQISIFNFSSDS